MNLSNSFAAVCRHLHFIILFQFFYVPKCFSVSNPIVNIPQLKEHYKSDKPNLQNFSTKLIDIGTNNQIHVIRLDNDDSLVDSSSPILFLLVGNKLNLVHPGTSINLEPIAILNDFNDFNVTFDSIKIIRSEIFLIIIANVKGGNYNVYLLLDSSQNNNYKNRKTTQNLRAIQRLPKHGRPQTLSTFTFEKDIFCLIGSNYVEENRSELRIFKWQRSYFQIVETISNLHHNIDVVIVNSIKQIILISDASKADDTDGIIQVYKYNIDMETGVDDEDSVNLRELHTKRVQDIFIPYRVQATNIIFYSKIQPASTYLIICNGTVINAVVKDMCTIYLWNEHLRSQRFVKVGSLEDLNSLKQYSLSLNLNIVPGDSTVLVNSIGSLITIQNKDKVIGFKANNTDASKNNFINIDIRAANLLHSIIVKTKYPDSTKQSYELLYITQISESQLQLHKLHMFDDETKASIGPNNKLLLSPGKMITTESQTDKMKRMHIMLIELKAQLKKELEQYEKPIKQQIKSIFQSNVNRKSEELAENLSARKMIAKQMEILSANRSTIKNLVINSDVQFKQIDELSKLLKELKRKTKINLDDQQKIVRKRSLVSGADGTSIWIGDTINVQHLHASSVRDLYTDQSIQAFKGHIKANILKTKAVSNQISNSSSESQAVIKGLLKVTKAEAPSIDISKHRPEIIVKYVNDINWNEFIMILYRKGKNIVVAGDLAFAKPTSVRSLYANSINGNAVNHFLTFSTDQTIAAFILISKVLVPHVDAQSINGINDFASAVAVIGQHNIIETEVRISTCNITNTLTLSDEEGQKMSQHVVGTRMEDLMQIYRKPVIIQGSLTIQNIVVPTTMSIIENDKLLYHNVMNVVVNDINFDFKAISENFWMKSIDQNFEYCAFSQPIKAPQLDTDVIDHHPAANFMVLQEGTIVEKKSLLNQLIFKGDTQVAGNLKSNFQTRLEVLNNEAIAAFEKSTINLSSSITFQDKLIVDHIEAPLSMEHFVQHYELLHPEENFKKSSLVKKEFANKLFIENDLVFTETKNPPRLQIKIFNNVEDLSKTFASIIRSDQPLYQKGTVIFDKDFSAISITVSKFIDNSGRKSFNYDNLFDLNEMLWELSRLEQPTIRYMQINGDVTFVSNEKGKTNKETSTLNAYNINGIKVRDYLQLLILKDNYSLLGPYGTKRPVIGGRKRFNNELFVQYNLNTVVVNHKIHVSEWMKKALQKQLYSSKGEQTINGSNWAFGSLQANNIYITNKLNDVKLNTDNYGEADIIFINNDPHYTINITSNFAFKHSDGIEIGGYATLTGYYVRPCNIRELFVSLYDIKNEFWKIIRIFGYCHIQESKYDESISKLYLSTLFKNVVLANITQFITTPITFRCSNVNDRIEIKEISKANANGAVPPFKQYGMPLISDTNLLTIFDDALIRGIFPINNISITGAKIFLKDNIECFGQTVVKTNMQTNFINDISMTAFNQSLIRKNTNILDISVRDKLVFNAPLSVVKISVDVNQTINGVFVKDILFIYTPLSIHPKPPVLVFKTEDLIHISHHLRIEQVNDFSFEFFIKSRVRLYTRPTDPPEIQYVKGHMTFDHLIIYGYKSTTAVINDIPIEDIVFSKSMNVQELTGKKHFKGIDGRSGVLHVNQPMSVWKINDIEWLETYLRTVFKNQNQTVDHLKVVFPYTIEVRNKLIVDSRLNGMPITAIQYAYRDEPSQANLRSVHEGFIGKRQNRLHFVEKSDDFKIQFDLSDDEVQIDTRKRSNWITVESMLSISTVLDSGSNNTNPTELSCPVQYHFRPSKNLLVHKSRSRLLVVHLLNNVIQVRTEFPLNENYYYNCKNFKQSSPLRSVVYVNHQEVMRFEHAIIESVNIFSNEKGDIFLILHIHRIHVLVFKNNISRWSRSWAKIQTISLDEDAASIFNVRLVSWQKQNILIIAKSDSINLEVPLPDNKNSGHTAQLFKFNISNEQFEKYSEILGDFNIISSIQIPIINGNDRTQTDLYLMLGKQEVNTMDLFKASDAEVDNPIEFKFQEQLRFDIGVQTISVFSEFGKIYLGIITGYGQFYIYQFHRNKLTQNLSFDLSSTDTASETMQWQLVSTGHLNGVTAMVPFVLNRKLYLFMIERASLRSNEDVAAAAKILTLFYY